MEKVMTQLLDLIKLPLPFVESLQKFDSLQEQKFIPYLRSLEDFMKPHHEFTQLCSEKIYDKTILIKTTESLYQQLNQFFNSITYKTFEDSIKENVEIIQKEENLIVYDTDDSDQTDSKFWSVNHEEIKKSSEMMKNGLGYFRSTNKDESYEFYGNWVDNSHRFGILLKSKNNFKEVFLGEFIVNKEDYTLNGQMIQIDDEKKTVGFILGESSNCGENIKGLYIFHETEKKSYEIYSGELKGSKKTGDKGLTIKFEENSTSRKVEAMISLINYGETADPILLYKENEYAVNVCKSSADQKLYTGVLKFSNEKESVFYGEIELNQEKKFIIGKEGILYLDNHVYKGEFKDNKKHGEGLYYILNENKEDTLILDAVFENDNIKYGFLYKELSDKTKVNVFKGEFNNNKPFKGIYSYPEGDQYEGELNDNGERNGNGKYTYKKDYSVYDGEWLKNLKDGIGEYKGVKYIWKDDQIIKKI